MHALQTAVAALALHDPEADVNDPEANSYVARDMRAGYDYNMI